MSCITSSNLSAFLNGERLTQFTPTSGIRQGDPLSPYIFILCMEHLAWLILKEVSLGNWKGIKSARNSLPFSHLFFANDLILFAKATKKNYSTIKKVLDTFCNLSGQKINLVKLKIFFSPHTSTSNMANMENELGISSSRNFGKYLGVPILTNKRDKRAFNFIIDKIRDKMASWKAKTLSLRVASLLSTSSLLPYPLTSCKATFCPNKSVRKLIKSIEISFGVILKLARKSTSKIGAQ